MKFVRALRGGQVTSPRLTAHGVAKTLLEAPDATPVRNGAPAELGAIRARRTAATLRRVLFLLAIFAGAQAASAAPQAGSTGPLPQLTPGIISTVAGKNYTGNSGYTGDGGPALSAEMYGPQSVAMDANGNYFISDSNNDVIRAVNNQSTAITILGVTIQPGDIQTVVGAYPGPGPAGGSYCGDGGPAGKACLNLPFQIRFDKQGNLFIADEGNFRIRAVNMQTTAVTLFGVTIQPGNIATVAGNNNASDGGYTTCSAAADQVGDGCPALQAGFNLPQGIAFDAAGNLYSADYGDFRIRRIDATTTVVTAVAGDGNLNYGGDGGNALEAELFDPVGIELDAAGNLYITELGSSRVRVVNTQSTARTFYGVTIQPGDIDTVAGSGTAVANQGSGSNTAAGYSGDGGPANQAHLDQPQSASLDAVGNLYIADQSNSLVRKVDVATGIITTIAGNLTDLGNANGRFYSGDGGPATSAGVANPAFMAFDSQGDLLFAEYGNEVIREINPSASAVDFPDVYPGSVSTPQAVTLQNAGNGTLTISNVALGGANPASFGYGTTCATTLAPGASCTFTFTFAPATSGGATATLTITESTPSASQTITLTGTGSSTAVAQLSVSASQLSFGNQTIGTTSASQQVTLTNVGSATFTPPANLTALVAIIGVHAGDFTEADNCDASLAAGASCTVNVSFIPQSAEAVSAFLAFEGAAKNAPQLVTLSGTGTPAGGSGGGTPPVLQVIPGVVSTVVGDGFDAGTRAYGGGYSGDGGPAVGAVLNEPLGVIEDALGDLYFTDSQNNVIRFVNMQTSAVTAVGVTVQPGDVQTVVGNGFGAGLKGGGYSGDGGPARSAELHTPGFVTLDPSGNIYFDDNANNVIRMVNTQSAAVTVNGVTVPSNAIQTVAGENQSTAVCAQAVDTVGDGCPATQAIVQGRGQIAFDTAGNLYIADGCYNVIRAVNMGPSARTIAGVVIQPGQIQIIAGTLTPTDKCAPQTNLGDGGPALSALFVDPIGIAVDASGNIYIVDADDLRIRFINTQSAPITRFGMTIPAGDVETIAGQSALGYSGDFGPATSATMTFASGIRLDAAGNVYFADTFNNVIRVVFASSGIIRTMAGNGYGAIPIGSNGKGILASYTGGYSGDGGAATSAEFFGPLDLSIDASGNAYVADIINRVIRQVSATPAGFNFPDTQVGATSAPEIYTFSNISAQAITFSGLTVSANFKQVSSGLTDCTAAITLPAGGTCQLALSFAPAETGPLTGIATATDTAGVQIINVTGTGTTAAGAVLQSITVTPPNPSIIKGATQQFVATGNFSDGSTQNISADVTWSSSNSAAASINPSTGLATGAGVGSAQITATQGSIKSPPATVTVTAVALASIAVTPANPSISKGQTQQFKATGTYTDNSTQDITTSVTWASMTATVATIDPTTGLATSVGVGATQVTATQGSIVSPAVTLTVTAPALQSIQVTPATPSIANTQTQQFTAIGTYSDASQQNITTTVTWNSSNTSVATIGTTTGLATGAGVGTTQITAMLGSITSPAVTLTVTAAPLQSISVTPAGQSIAKGQTQQFAATGKYADGSTQNITTSVTWASGTTSVATIGANTGLATGAGIGRSQITATQGSITSTPVTLTVTAAILETIAVTPANPTIALNGAQQFTATGTYSDLSTQNLTTSVAWSSATTSVATIGAATGLASGVGAGTSKIQAALSGTTGATTLTVNNPVPAITSLAPPHAPAGAALALTVNGSGFLPASTVTFNGKSETAAYVSAAQLTISIPATDLSAGGSDPVIVTNPAPGGGASAAASFTADDFTVSGPAAPLSLSKSQSATAMIAITPSANGFANAIQLSVSNMPAGVTAQFVPGPTVTPGSTGATLSLSITDNSAVAKFAPAGKSPLGPAALLLVLFAAAALAVRRRVEWRILASAPAALVLWLIVFAGVGVSLAGCGGGFPSLNQKASITVTGASGTLQHTTQVTVVLE